MDTTPEQEISDLISELVATWSKKDAKAFSRRFHRDGTFTNIFGQTFEGQPEFEKRHADIFDGIFQGTEFELQLLKLKFPRPDVAIADLDTRVIGISKPLPAPIQVSPGVPLHTRLMLVLVREDDGWWMVGYHNVAVRSPSTT